jgi:O-antigen ligase
VVDTRGEQLAPVRSLDGLLEGGWLLIAVLLPLWVNLWADQPFELSKVLLFRSLVWLLTAAWLADRVHNGPHRFFPSERNPLLLPVGILAAALLLSTLFALDPRLSLLGSYVRGQGLLTHVSYLLLFLIVAYRLRAPEQVLRLFAAVVFTALPLGLLSLLQGIGQDPLGMVTDARSPIYATLGRANFVGAYLAQVLPLTLALALLVPQHRHRRLLLLLAGAQVAVIAWTLTRGAWLAAGVALTLFGLLWVWPRLSHRVRPAVVVTGAVIAVAVLVGASYILLGAESGSILARRTIWTAVWGLVRQRPLLGYGLDAVEVVFPRVYPPQLVYYQGRQVFVDRAHNVALDWAVTTGLIGALSYLFVVARFLILGRQRARGAGRQRRILLIAALASVAGNLAGTLSGFDVTPTAVLTWLLMAVVASPAMASRAVRDELAASPAGAVTAPWARWAVTGLLGMGAVFLVIHFNVRPLLASVAHRTAVRHAQAGDLAPAVEAALQAAAYGAWEPEHHRLAGQLVWRQAESSGDLDAWQRAEIALLTARDLRSLDFSSWAWLGDFYGAIGVHMDPGAFTLAHQAYGQATSLSPNRARLYVAWGQIYLIEDRPELALDRFYQAVDLDATDDLAFRLIGDVQLALENPEGALEAYQEAVHWAPEAPLAHLGMARSYVALGQPADARSAWERALALDPGHPAIRAVQQELDPGR